MSKKEEESVGLKREIGLVSAISMIMAVMIGKKIFLLSEAKHV